MPDAARSFDARQDFACERFKFLRAEVSQGDLEAIAMADSTIYNGRFRRKRTFILASGQNRLASKRVALLSSAGCSSRYLMQVLVHIHEHLSKVQKAPGREENLAILMWHEPCNVPHAARSFDACPACAYEDNNYLRA